VPLRLGGGGFWATGKDKLMTPTSDPSPPGEIATATELRAIARNLGPVDRALVEAAATRLDDLIRQKAGLEALLVDAQEEIAELKAALRPFADEERYRKRVGYPRVIGRKHFVRAAELIPEQNT
jgi:hypothetical protein